MVQVDNGNALHPKRELLERPLEELAREERLGVVRHLLAGCAACGAVARERWLGPHPLAPSPEGRGGRSRGGLRLV